MSRLLSFCLLGALSAVTLTSCDYNNGPGKEPQFNQDFTDGPKATAAETDLDSVSKSQAVYTPIGKGSAADQKSSVNAATDAQPGNSSTNSMPQTNAEAKSTTREN